MKLRWPLVLATAVLVIAAVPAVNADAATRAECPRTTGVVNGTTGNDTIYGTPGDDVICAGSGDDTVYGKGGVDTMYGGPGNDKIYGGNAREWLFGGSGSTVSVIGGFLWYRRRPPWAYAGFVGRAVQLGSNWSVDGVAGTCSIRQMLA